MYPRVCGSEISYKEVLYDVLLLEVYQHGYKGVQLGETIYISRMYSQGSN
jgi:hypothetical protein